MWNGLLLYDEGLLFYGEGFIIVPFHEIRFALKKSHIGHVTHIYQNDFGFSGWWHLFIKYVGD